MKWIGITGGIATGKSTVTTRLRTLGYEVLDADAISHQVTGPGGAALPQIFTVFGPSVRTSDGGLDRKALGHLVFGREDQRKKLEGIIHPLVRAEVAKEKVRLQDEGQKVAFYDVPLLFEKQMEKDFDAVLLVSSTEDLQLQRLMKRNSLTEAEARSRLLSQIPIQEKEKKTKYIIHNTRDLSHLENEVDRLLKELKV
ncbi:dephospho-CoA kinase [Bdellovibrio sp. HCB337]|uniref:dephospho-CoA kinase n=1 Tax=Bdellovibrio sp. HCB337 TaxID=3394358 RepID=UPI0039A75183